MRNLYDLQISVLGPNDIDDPKHCQITVEPAVNAENYDEFFPPGQPDEVVDPVLRDVGRYHAGILARLAMDLAPWIDEARRDHGCARGGPLKVYEDSAPGWYDACGISHGGLLEPGSEECHQPTIWFYVPHNQRKHWLGRIRDGLAAIAANDQGGS